MTIERVKKITLLAPAAETHPLLASLQELGCVHLLRSNGSGAAAATLPEAAEQATSALRYLRGVDRRRRQARRRDGLDSRELVKEVLANQQQRRLLMDRRDQLSHRIEALAPWGDFEPPGDGALGALKLWLYKAPLALLPALRDSDLCYCVASSDNRFSYLAVVDGARPGGPLANLTPVDYGPERLSELRQALLGVELELEDVNAQRASLTRWIRLLEEDLARLEDRARLEDACRQFATEEPLARIQGWVAASDVAAVQTLAREHRAALAVDRVHRHDRPPTLIRNPPAFAAGQDIVSFFSTPAYHGWDPSALVMLSFVLFFAMILADAGYALLLGVVLAYYYRPLGRSEPGRRFRGLTALLCGASLVYGVLVGSYWGSPPPADGLLGTLDVIDLEDYDAMMRLTIGLGALHVLLATLLSGASSNRRSERLTALGWSGCLLGCFGLWLNGGPLGEFNGWTALAAAGGLLVVLYADPRPVKDARSALTRFGGGLLAVRQITKLFGDVLSYLRLFALGLASSTLAVTFNQLARDAADNIAGLGLLIAIVTVTVGHALNLALAVLGGLVHGLRLNLIEFLSWGLSGEGYPFRPFERKEAQP